ncbi:MAG: hypothetical protein WCS15_09455 [Prevotella sp.]|nr:hypothetical protein [Prevotella sp.]
MKKRITNYLLALALLTATAGTFVSCKDYEDSAAVEGVAKNANLIEALTQQVNNLKTDLANCRTECDQNKATLLNLINVNKDAIAANGEKIATNAQNIAALKTLVEKNSADIAANAQRIAAAEVAIQQNAGAIDLLNQTVAANGQTIAKNSLAIIDLQARVTTLEGTVQDMQASIDKYSTVSTRVDSVVNAIKDINLTAIKAMALAQDDSVRLDALHNTVIGLQDDVVALYAKALADSTTAADALKLAQQTNLLATSSLQRIEDLEASRVTVAQLNAAIAAAKAQLQTQFDALDSRITALENALKQQVTSITVNGAYSPIIGSYALPMGDIRNTILSAYYGDAASFRFPTSTQSFYADSRYTLSDADLEITGQTGRPLEGGTVIVSEDGQEGNAGTLYMTLNPTNVDLTGKTFALVNSQGTESAVKLSPVVSSDKVLTFGYTRANTNGFYETKATVTADIAKSVQPALVKSDIAKVAAELVNTFAGGPTDLTKVVGLLYTNFKDVLPALALKTFWDANGTVNSALSQYSVAATAVNPLSFGTLQNLNIQLPKITALQQLGVNIDTLYVNSFGPSQPYTVTIKYNDGTEKTLSIDEINALVDKINTNYSNTVGSVNDYIAIFNNLSDRLSSFINKFNLRLQPAMFIYKNNSLYLLSNVPYATDAVTSGTNITFTSYTAELLAPAYKKWVAVTNVWNTSEDAVKDKVGGQIVASAQNGDATLKAALADANNGENMNQIVFGTTRNGNLGTLQSGKVYEISYSAVDFHGKVAARKFYVRGE